MRVKMTKRIHIRFFLLIPFLLFLGQVSLMFGFTQTNSVILSLSLYNSDKLSVTNFGNTTLSFGNLLKNTTNWQTTVDPRAIFKNNGTTAVDYQLKAETNAGGISITLLTNGGLGNPIPGNDELRILALFQEWDKPLNYTKTDFTIDDRLTTSFRTADASVFAKVTDAENLKGYNVPPNDQRNIRFCFEPGPVTVEGNKTITVYIKALKH